MTAGAPCRQDTNRFPTRHGQNAGPFPRKKRAVPSLAKHPIVRQKPPRQRQVPACSGRFPPGHAVFRHDGRKPPFSPPYTGQSGPCRLHASVTKKDGNVPACFPPANSTGASRTNRHHCFRQPHHSSPHEPSSEPSATFWLFRAQKKMAHRNGAPSIPKNTVQFDTSSKSIS